MSNNKFVYQDNVKEVWDPYAFFRNSMNNTLSKIYTIEVQKDNTIVTFKQPNYPENSCYFCKHYSGVELPNPITPWRCSIDSCYHNSCSKFEKKDPPTTVIPNTCSICKNTKYMKELHNNDVIFTCIFDDAEKTCPVYCDHFTFDMDKLIYSLPFDTEID